jgi:hypothetical protein
VRPYYLEIEKKVMVKAGFLFLALVCGNVLFAGTPVPPNPPAGANIDAGAIFLLIVGVALTVYKMYRKKQQSVATNI